MKFFLYGDHLNPTQLNVVLRSISFSCCYHPDHTIKFCDGPRNGAAARSVTPSPEKKSGSGLEVTDEDLKLMDLFEKMYPKRVSPGQVTVITEPEKMLVTTYAATPIGKFKPKRTISIG